MGMKAKKILSLALFLSFFIPGTGIGQNDPDSQFKFGYELLLEGRYDLAMEVFNPLASHNSNYKFKAESAYYYSVAAKNAGYFYQARWMMINSVTQFRDWKYIDHSYLLLSEIYFLQNDYQNACLSLKNLKEDLNIDQGSKMKVRYLEKLNDEDSLKTLFFSFPEDKELAIILASKISSPPFEAGDELILENIIDFFELDPEQFNLASNRILKKDYYNVAVLLPFKWKLTLRNYQYFKNRFAYSIYSGILKAADSLARLGIGIRIRPFDTEQSSFKVEEILKDTVLANSDLIIGPMYPHLSSTVMQYGKERRINVVNPLSKNIELIEGNPYGYLFQVPETISAQRLSKLARDSSWYDSTSHPGLILSDLSKDTILVELYFNEFKDDSTFRLDSAFLFDPLDREQISNYIHRDTLDSISISHIFIPTNNKALASRILSSADRINADFPILGHSAWVEYLNISLEQLERRSVYFIWGDWLRWNPDLFWLLQKEPKFDQKPDYFSCLGFEVMYFFGNRLERYGRYFQKGLIDEGPTLGVFFPGFNYSKGNYNSFTPLLRVRGNRLEWLNKVELFSDKN
jgi:hypothetical protein